MQRYPPAPSTQPLIPSSVPPLLGQCASLCCALPPQLTTSSANLGHSSTGQKTTVQQQPIQSSFSIMVLPACSWPGARQQHPPSPWTGWRMWWWTWSSQWSQQRQSWCSWVSTGWPGHTAQKLAKGAQHGGQQQSWQPLMALSPGWMGTQPRSLQRVLSLKASSNHGSHPWLCQPEN